MSRDLVQRLAERLYLVGEAVECLQTGAPRDAFVQVRASHDPGVDASSCDAFARRIGAM